jgi:hypothetical protein
LPLDSGASLVSIPIWTSLSKLHLGSHLYVFS